MKLSTKLISVFLLITLVMIAVGVLGVQSQNTANAMLNNMDDNNLRSIADVANANMRAIYQHRSVYAYIIGSRKSGLDNIQKEMGANEAKRKELLDEYHKIFLTDKEKALLVKFDAGWPPYRVSVERYCPCPMPEEMTRQWP